MNKKNTSFLIAFLFLFSGLNLFGQFKYWVTFTDKIGTPFTLSNPSTFLTQKSIDRRTTYNIPLDATDLPVNPTYISQIESVPNVTVLYASKWLNGVVVSVPSRSQAVTALTTIRTFSFVLDTNKVKRYHINNNDPVEINPKSEFPVARSSSNTSSAYSYGGSYWQTEQLNLIPLHESGYRGQGMTIAVLDAGFTTVDTYHVFDSLRNRGGILGTRNFVDGGTNVYSGSNHGTMVLSCIAGNKPGRILGSAPLANFWLFRTEEAAGETISEEYNWIRGAEFADSVGVDILTTSLGYTDFDDHNMDHTYATLTGRKAPMSIAANMAARKGLFVLNAAGNEGAAAFHYISIPGDADSICTVGAVDSLDRVAAFSSVGPTFDGRIKPDLVARGVGSWVSDGNYDGFPGNGTSFATPILAGAVACFWQAHKDYNNIKVLETLKKEANNHCVPNNSRGWGLPKMAPYKFELKSSAFLNCKHDHSGILIKFTAASTIAVSDSAYTKADGTYSVGLSKGKYKISFAKNNYYDVDKSDTLSILIDCSPNSVSTLSLLPLPTAPLKFELKSSALLNAKIDHSGILVKFTSLSSLAQSDSTYTDFNGTYSITLNKGLYKISFSKKYYNDLNNNDTLALLTDCSSTSINSVTLVPLPSAPKVDFDFTGFADPTDLQMTIRLTDAGYEFITIEIADLMGHTLSKLDYNPYNLMMTYDISSLADAIYIIKVQTNKGTKVKKILKL
ncbi:S8 family serine peptidase [Aurantibacillus circumpalustris]|uniref:S8 family serine peptidase n=1 Tax=Aurantibacillus circumpalustris TaxID=3036359 RepID=UPI00295BD312|nr:S8 family serine peptidase [Aurantibacillus circumpalustris]